MFVRDRMSSPAVTVQPDAPFPEAMQLLRERKFRRLPVVDKDGRLVGIVSERDLLYASPSPASSLSIWEMNYLLAQLKIEEIMTTPVITTTPETPIEDAAHLMVTHKVGGLPVVDDENRVVGVITETDIFKTFVEMLSGGEQGLRLYIQVPERKGVLAQLATTIAELGGNIVSVGTFQGESAEERRLLVKVQGVAKEQLVDTLETLGDHVLDAREL
ncbi:MAG: CBS and ACT domain-containing protein [Ardenticatenia bacterium]|nr:CBS and ACT domain-containing protein [Ardenticatenia bacterium]